MKHICAGIQGWCNYADLYRQLVQDLPEGFKFAEVGVWKGQSIAFFTVEAINANKRGDIYAVDHWLGSVEHKDDPIFNEPDGLYNHFLSNIEPIKDYIKPIRKPSTEAAAMFDNDFFDAVFIDASHEYQDVMDDLIAWYPKVKKDGYFYGHDYDWTEVKRAVDEFAAKNNLRVERISMSSWRLVDV